MAAIPGVLDHTADQIEAFMSQLGGLHQAVCANAVPAELSDEFEMGSSSIASSGTADDATKEVVTSLKDILGMHTDQADSQVVDSVLRHGRLRSALLQLLVFTVRWERLTQQTSQQPITASDVEQLQPLTSTAEEENGRQCTAGPACGSVLSCRFFLLGILSSMLKTGAEQLTDPNSARTGAGSGVVQRLGSRRRFGAAAATTLEPGGPSASDGPPLSLLALDLGCALLRMHTLQCCSRQVAAVCAWMGGDGEEQLQQEQQQQEEEQQRAQVRLRRLPCLSLNIITRVPRGSPLYTTNQCDPLLGSVCLSHARTTTLVRGKGLEIATSLAARFYGVPLDFGPLDC